MKFLNYLGTLFIPSKMSQRKNMSGIIAFLILLLSSIIISIPYIKTFEKQAYDVYVAGENYNFKVMDNKYSNEVLFTEEEKAKFGDEYVLSNVNELKNIEFNIVNGTYIMPEGVQSYKDIEYNGKEYLLKREVYSFDSEGTKLDEVETCYIHIVFDIFTNLKDGQYVIKEDFDKKLNFADEDHFLIVFYIDGFAYRNEYMVDNNIQSYGYGYDKNNIIFKDIDSMEYITRQLTEMLIPETKNQYSFLGFIYAVLAPILMALIAQTFIRKKNGLNKFKHYFNIAALSSIPVVIVFFIIEWIPFFIRLGIMEFYWILFAVYYFTVLSIVAKTYHIE